MLHRTHFFFIILLFIACSCSQTHTTNYSEFKGSAQGTYYRVLVEHTQNRDTLSQHIEEILADFDTVFSNYIPQSLISTCNRSEKFTYNNPHFYYFLQKSSHFYSLTKGAFDITIAPLANAWKFGYTSNDSSTPSHDTIATIMKYVGMNSVTFDSTQVHKKAETKLISNAIAQGYSCDIIAQFLEQNNMHNYLIDVGGEMKVKGKNPKGQNWKIGIQKPVEGASTQDYNIIVELENISLATSGNYRKFYIKNGKKYSHTIDPLTGYPVSHNLLSATIITQECIDADAAATACMVMGLEESKKFIINNESFEGILIYDDSDSLKTFISKGIQKNIISLKK
ncbi:MAG: FAD:protein FMN transferase [Bacteroidales bacterium]